MAVAETTEIKMHSSGAPYQLGGLGWKTDLIEDGLTFTYDVADGDVILCYSDGISGNLEPSEIARIASTRGPAAEVAKALVERAREKKLVDDDCTVVALQLGQGRACSPAPILTTEAPWEKFGLRVLG